MGTAGLSKNETKMCRYSHVQDNSKSLISVFKIKGYLLPLGFKIKGATSNWIHIEKGKWHGFIMRFITYKQTQWIQVSALCTLHMFTSLNRMFFHTNIFRLINRVFFLRLTNTNKYVIINVNCSQLFRRLFVYLTNNTGKVFTSYFKQLFFSTLMNDVVYVFAVYSICLPTRLWFSFYFKWDRFDKKRALSTSVSRWVTKH